jgi:thermitase
MLNKLKVTLMLFFISGVLSAEYVPGEIIVKMKKSANLSSYVGVSEITGSDFKVIKIDKDKDVIEAAAELAKDPNIEYAEPNYIFHISSVPNDTYYSTNKLWGLNNTGQTISGTDSMSANNPGNSGDDINAEEAWTLITDCSTRTVAVIDTGVRYTHEDLIDNMWNGGGSYPNHGYDFFNSDNNPDDDNGHGSHVSGIIGARGNNAKGVAGVCWRIKIMALKSFGAGGDGDVISIIPAVDFAINHGANVINASFNMYGAASAALSAKITEAEQAGILFVAAAGNGDGSAGAAGYNVDTGIKTYPCCYTQDNILCVAAVDQKFQRTSFSNYGATSVDVGAPGINVWSAWNTSNSAYKIESGTSMATPYTAGLAALVWADNPSYTYLDVKHAVMYGGAAVSSMANVTVSGKVINAYNALNYINAPTGLTAVVSQ